MNNNRILKEWLDANGNKVALNSISNTPGTKQSNDLFKDKFMKLAKHMKDCHPSLVNYLSEWELDIDYAFEVDLDIIEYNLYIDVDSKHINVRVTEIYTGKEMFTFIAQHNEWSNVLDELKDHFVIKDKKLCESASMSTIDGFKLYENLLELTEAKADTQRLIDFAGEELANRFFAIKPRLKYPENDLYYWIKNKTVDDLKQVVLNAEETKSKRQLSKEKKLNGAELVCETDNWKVYHITTFEASQALGRDTKWCITGVHGSDYYWKDYTDKGVDFYFLITKGEYDPRGLYSKVALAVYPWDRLSVYNQQDDAISLEDVPHIDEINIPGIDLNSMEVYEDEMIFCYLCDSEIAEEDAWLAPEGEPLCYDCWSESYFSCYYCNETFEYAEAPSAEEVDCEYPVCRACAEKYNLYYDSADYKEATSSFEVFVAGTDKKAIEEGVTHEAALNSIISFIRSCKTKAELQKLVITWNEDSEAGDWGSDMIASIDAPNTRENPDTPIQNCLEVGRPDIEGNKIKSALMMANMIAR